MNSSAENRLRIINTKEEKKVLSKDPTKNAMSREQINRTYQFIKAHFPLFGKSVIDLSYAGLSLSELLQQEGAQVTICDLPLPRTKLPDESYDLVLADDVIARIPSKDYRLAVAEINRLIQKNGKVFCSTAIDIDSEDALERFVQLMQTEFKIEAWAFSYHAYAVRVLNFFKWPARYYKSWKSPYCYFWWPLKILLTPLVYLFEQNRRIVLWLEKLCHLINSDRGISHIMIIGSRRPLIEIKEEEKVALPDRKPFRKTVVWE